MSDNIQVAIRVRPLISREENEKLAVQWEVQDNLIYPIDSNGKRNGDSYGFDHIFDGKCSNEDIYRTVVHPVVDGAINGFNGTIFAYGQTSSGKTYTMAGDENEPGLITIAVKNIFLAIKQAVDRKFLLRVSYMEIYNEKVFDLLDIKNNVTIHENTKGILLNLKEEYTDCPEKVYMAMKHGNKARRIGETSMNEKSSRSHAIFRIIIESSDVKDDKGVVVNVAHLNLVDLAGSERAAQTKATGVRLKEGTHINKSLSTLSLVMKQLSESQDFINFRDSKLTRILQSSLGGNARTAIICAVTPAALEETHSTLAFASRAKIVKNKPCLNEVLTDEAVIIRYALQIKKLKKDLEEAKDKAKFHETVQEKISRIERYMIYSSKSTDKKKANPSRRKTWCAPRNNLPVIDEIDILKHQTDDTLPTIIGSSENLDTEEFPDDLFDLEIQSRNLPCTQRKMHHPFSLTRGLPFPTKITPDEPVSTSETTMDEEEKIEQEKTEETGIDTKEVVKWLVNETGTPKSVLRDRASFYNEELTALKELTDKEKEILCIEHSKEIEKLHSKISQLESDLRCEEIIKNQLKTEKEKKQSQNDELKKKNAELSRINFQLQKAQNKNNDAEYMLEMMKEKYKKREKELLEQLTEARQSLSYTSIQDFGMSSQSQINVGSQFDLTTQVDASTQSSDITSQQFDFIQDSEDITNKLKDYKNKIISIKEELMTSDLADFDILITFNELNKQSEELSNEFPNYSEDVQEQFLTLKSMLENITYLFTFEKTIKNHELDISKYVNRIANNQRKEITYEKLVKEQGDEIKHLSKKLLESMQREQDLEAVEQSHKSKIDAIKKDYAEIISTKDKEIEDLSDKIMEYIDLITPLEEDSKKYQELLNTKATETENTIIQDLNDKLDSSTKQINSLTEELERTQNELATNKDVIAQLTTDLETKSKEILALNEENKDLQVNELKDTIQSLTFELQSKSEIVSKLQDNTDALQLEFDNKNKEISDLLKEKSELEVKSEELTNTHQIEINNKNREISDLLKEKSELEVKSEELTNTHQIEINNKNREISELLKEKSELENKSEELTNTLQLEINNKNEKISELLKEKSELEDALQLVINNRNENISELLKEKSELQNKYEELQEENNKMTELQKELNEANDQLDELRELKTKLELLEETNIKIKDHSELIQLKNLEIESLKEKLSTVVTGPNTDKLNEMVKKSEILEDKLLHYEDQLASKDTKLQSYKNQLHTKKDLIRQLSDEIELLNEKIITYESHIDALANQIEDQTKTIESHNTEILQIYKYQEDTVFSNKPSIIINNEETIITSGKDMALVNRSDLIDFENQIRNYCQVCNDQVVEISSLKERVINYEGKYEQLETTLNVIQDIVINKFGEYIKINEDNKTIMQLIRDTETAIETLKTELAGKQETSSELLKQLILNYSRELEHFQSNKNNLEQNKLLLEQKRNEVSQLTNELSTINEKLETCKDDVNALNIEKEILEIQLNEYQPVDAELNALHCTIEGQDLEIEALTSKLEETQNKLLSYESNREDLKSSVQMFKDKIDEYMESKNNAEKLLRDKEDKKEQLNLKMSEYKEQQNNIINNIQLLKEQVISKTSALESMQTELNLATINQQVQDIDQEISRSCEELNKYEQQLNVYDLDVKMLTSIFTWSSTFLYNIDNKRSLLDSEIESLRNTLQQKTHEIQEQENARMQKECELKALQDSLYEEKQKYEQEILILIKEKENIFLEKDSEIQARDKEKQEITDLNNKIIELNVQIQGLTKEQENVRAQKECEMKALQDSLHEEKQNYEQELSVLNNKIIELNVQVQDLIKEKENIFLEKDSEIQARDKEKQKITDLNNKIIELNVQIQGLTKEQVNIHMKKDCEMKVLKDSLNEEKLKYEQYKQEITDLIKEKENIILEKDSEIQALIEYKQKYEQYKQEITDLNNKITELNVAVQDLTKEQENLITQKTIEIEALKECFNKEKQKYDEQIKESLETKQFEIAKMNENLTQKNNELIIKKNEVVLTKLNWEEAASKYNKDILEKQNEIQQLNNKIRNLEKYQLNENFKKEFNNMLNVEMNKLGMHKELIKTVNVYSEKIESCNKAVNLVRTQLEVTKNALKIKEEQLNIILAKILAHMKPKCEICTDVDIETFTQQCNLAFSSNEIKKLRHENSEYKALVTKIRQKSGAQISNLQNILVKTQSENEKLQISVSTNIAAIKSLEEKIRYLQNEIGKASDKDSVATVLQSKIKVLEDDKKELKHVNDYLQQRTTQIIAESKEYKKRLDFLKKENAELSKCNADYLHLKKKLAAAEESLKTAQASIKQLELEKDNFNATSRSLEESLEDAKFELYALKNKERERVKKHKRRSLHDSSRVLSEFEDSPSIEQQQDKSGEQHKQDKENQITTECERCKERENDDQTYERPSEISKLKDEVKSWRRKYDLCKDLCIVRKRKIEELEIENRRARE